MGDIKTNRDLYIAIADLVRRHRSNTRDLEEYLRALLDSAHRFSASFVLSVDELIDILSTAFAGTAPVFDDQWRSLNDLGDTEATKFKEWQTFIIRQIVDLREMAEQGMLADKMRYFGIDSPSGHRWYNFDPCTFIECAMAGSYGGWEMGDVTGRIYVPGPVAVLGDDGKLTIHDPKEIESPDYPIVEVSWADFRNFLENGQCYE